SLVLVCLATVCAVYCFAAGADTPDEAVPLEQDFHVTVPAEKGPLPHPLPEGASPGFPVRGTKGWLWTPDQYLAEIPVLLEYKLNFLMICYGSMMDIEHHPWGSPQCNRWWEPLPDAKRAGFEKVLKACQDHGIELCLSVNPVLFAERPFDYRSDEDFELLWQHYDWLQQKGMRWFCLSLDDIQQGIDAAGQAIAANRLLAKLREADPGAQLLFCPTYYWGDGSEPEAAAYLETLAADLDDDVYVFWTGDAVVTPRITRRAAEAYKARVGHELFIWDNYPVNDGHRTLHLGPLTGRDADLNEVCAGYMANPMRSENELNRIPLLTIADYAYNPTQYDPGRSLGQAILHMSKNKQQRDVLKDLVELFPGMLIFNKGTSFNPVLTRFDELRALPHSRQVTALYVEHVESVARRLDAAFPKMFAPGKQTLAETINEMRRRMNVTN
ncbi:MAG: beta-N-acetylglucosaminidase domain-containing protein, partial [Candidatus Hydrogenedentes bacterium]|nr:beta-N-acetylglucosaminidase domain-containing protein [Candidatus Hydrogenedentota bacterium]